MSRHPRCGMPCEATDGGDRCTCGCLDADRLAARDPRAAYRSEVRRDVERARKLLARHGIYLPASPGGAEGGGR